MKRFLIAAVCLGVCLLSVAACRSATPTGVARKTDCGIVQAFPPDTKTVTVDREGRLSGDVEEGIVYFDKPGQVVFWEQANGEPLDIVFENRFAFAREFSQPSRKGFRVARNAICAAHKYTIVLGERKIDPIVIVRY
jgi:hypothetical protein